jgi:hypothetical protein
MVRIYGAGFQNLSFVLGVLSSFRCMRAVQLTRGASATANGMSKTVSYLPFGPAYFQVFGGFDYLNASPVKIFYKLLHPLF